MSSATKALAWACAAVLLPGATALYGAIGFETDAHGCVTNYDENVDYFPPATRAMMGDTSGVVHHDAVLAEDFSISYHRTYKILRNLKNKKVWILRQCGTPELDPGLVASAAGEGFAYMSTFTVPVKKWSTGGTVPISFVEEIGMGSALAVVDKTYMTSSCGQKLVACGAIHAPAVTYGSAWTASVNESDSEVHFTDDFNTGASKLDIDVAFDASSDPGMLHRAEWLKFVAAFFNKEAEANHVFDGIRSRFIAIAEMALDKRLAGGPAPRAAFVTHNAESVWSGVTYPETFEIANTEYLQEVIFKAGGKNVDATFAKSKCPLNWNGQKFSCPNAAAMKEVLKTCDVVFDQSYPSGGNYPSYTLDTFQTRFKLSAADASSGDYPFLKSRNLWRMDKHLGPPTAFGGYGTDYFESAIPHADKFLNDIAAALVPTTFPSYATRFIRNIAAGKDTVVVDSTSCTDSFAVCPGETAPPMPATVFNFCEGDICLLPAPPSPPGPWEDEARGAGWTPPCKDGARRLAQVRNKRKLGLSPGAKAWLQTSVDDD